jgi:sarcosine reductase
LKLDYCKFHVHTIAFGQKTCLQDSILTINAEELRQVVLSDAALTSVDLSLAQPGESARIVHVLDALPIIRKAEGQRETYSGFLGMPQTVGDGVTHILDGVTVLTCAEMPWGAGGLLIPREGIVDMSGPGADYSPFAGLCNVVLGLHLAQDYSDEELDRSVRMAGLRVVRYLAQVTEGLKPDVMQHYELVPTAAELPRIVYIHQFQSQGLFAHTFVYGRNADAILPTLIHPNELLDGAVLSGNYVYACYKTATYLHCLNPVVQELYDGHGKTHNFAGVILSRGHHYTYADKVRSASYAANLAQMLGCQGAVITWEGGGNSIIEAMTTVQKCELAGIKTSIIAYEFGNDAGTQSVLLDSVPEASAVVSAGSTERAVRLPRMERILGGSLELRLDPALGGVRMPAAGPLEFDTSHALFCSANQVGFGRLAAREF